MSSSQPLLEGISRIKGSQKNLGRWFSHHMRMRNISTLRSTRDNTSKKILTFASSYSKWSFHKKVVGWNMMLSKRKLNTMMVIGIPRRWMMLIGHRQNSWIKRLILMVDNLNCLLGSRGSSIYSRTMHRTWQRIHLMIRFSWDW